MGVTPKEAATLENWVEQDMEVMKPDWCRVTFNYLTNDMQWKCVMRDLKQIATHGWILLSLCIVESKIVNFVPQDGINICLPLPYSVNNLGNFTYRKGEQSDFSQPKSFQGERKEIEYRQTI